MDLKIAARMIAVLTLGSGLTAAVVALRGDGAMDGLGEAPAQNLRDPGGEPMSHPFGRSELARCRDIGQAALDDTACREAWAESRRRFFETARPGEPAQPKPERFGPAPAADATAQPPANAGKADAP